MLAVPTEMVIPITITPSNKPILDTMSATTLNQMLEGGGKEGGGGMMEWKVGGAREGGGVRRREILQAVHAETWQSGHWFHHLDARNIPLGEFLLCLQNPEGPLISGPDQVALER